MLLYQQLVRCFPLCTSHLCNLLGGQSPLLLFATLVRMFPCTEIFSSLKNSVTITLRKALTPTSRQLLLPDRSSCHTFKRARRTSSHANAIWLFLLISRKYLGQHRTTWRQPPDKTLTQSQCFQLGYIPHRPLRHSFFTTGINRSPSWREMETSLWSDKSERLCTLAFAAKRESSSCTRIYSATQHPSAWW